MKIGSNQRSGFNVPTESNVISENKTDKTKSIINKAVDTMTDARTDSFAADGKITMGERVKNSESKKVFDWAVTDEE